MNLNEKSKLYKDAREEMNRLKDHFEVELANSILDKKIENRYTYLEKLDHCDRTLVRLNKTIGQTENLISREFQEKIKPQNCINNVLNGGGCNCDTMWRCRNDPICFDLIEETENA
jgi:hypothetical protein